jgi:hypothetical protein
MFDRDNLNPNDSGSKKEDDKALLYSGFEILAYRGISNQETLSEKVKLLFNNDGWNFSTEYGNRFFIENNIDKVEIIFKETYANKVKYKITFKSTFFGFKTGEKKHQELYQMVYSRIPWKKRGFWIKEGNRFPILRKIRLKLKR